MEQKDEFGKNLPWIIIVSLIIGIVCGISAETTHWLLNIASGIGVGFLALVALSSAFLSR